MAASAPATKSRKHFIKNIFKSAGAKVKTAKTEAIKEFSERLKSTPCRFREEQTTSWDKPPIAKMVLFVDDNDIDNLVKEMTGETK